MIYLDNAATTYPKPEVVYDALNIANRNAFNAGRGSYKYAREAMYRMDSVRDKLLKVCNAYDASVIFTPSATYALNDIILHTDINEGEHIYISPFEHNSIIRTLESLKRKKNIHIHVIPFDKKTWKLDEDGIKNMFVLYKPKVILLSHISNVTGFILPYEKIFDLAVKYQSIHILDASQSFGIVKIKNIDLINYIVFAGHKSLYSSFGIAGFIKNKRDKLDHFIFGGTGADTMNVDMPLSGHNAYEAGSPNIVAISGLNVSIDWLKQVDIYKEEKEKTNYLIRQLEKIKKVKMFLPENNENILGIVSFAVEGYTADEVGKILDDEFDICVRTGYHCAPLIHNFIDSIIYGGTVRVSLSYFTTKEEIETLIEAIKTL